jgi:predicted negative regulator of RcsB-dependent stress response
MKSQHRHELETNWLAKRLAKWIDEIRPYSSTIVGVLIVAAILLFGFSYFAGSTASRQSEAWSAYHQAVEGFYPNLDELRQSAEEHAGTAMQQWADVTWADGQVLTAAQYYLVNRSTANEALSRAAGTYRNLLEDTDDERIKGRAQFGLGRVYELRNELDKAREEYYAVRGGFEELAKLRAEQLADPQTVDSYAWLATAQAPLRTTPAGPGTPGQRPDFSAGGLDIPSSGEATTDGETGEDLFQGFELPDVDADEAAMDDASVDGADAATDQAAEETQVP